VSAANHQSEPLQHRRFRSAAGLAEEVPLLEVVEVRSRPADLLEDAPAFLGHGFEGFCESCFVFEMSLVDGVHFEQLLVEGVAGEDCGGDRSEVSDVLSESVLRFEDFFVRVIC